LSRVELSRAISTPPLPSLKPTTIHHELLGGAGGAIVRSEEEDHLGELLGQDAALEGLISQRSRFAFGTRKEVSDS
jgi:hypothetical protein